MNARGNWRGSWKLRVQRLKGALRRGGGVYGGIARPLVEEYEEGTGCG